MKPLGIAIIMEDNLEETLQWAKRSGFDNCQLQLWNMDYLCREHAEYVKKLLDSCGMEVTGLWCGWHGPIKWDFAEGPSILGIVPPKYRASRTRNLLEGAEYARILGVKDIITHLGFVPTNCRDINYTGVVSALKYITAELKKHGQNFLMETGQEPPIVLLRLIEDVGSDNLFINYDPANLMMYGSANPIDGLEVLRRYIRSVHIKDGSYPRKGHELGLEYPIGKGEVDFPRLVGRLKMMKYEGPMSVEYEIEAGNERQKQEILGGKSMKRKLYSTATALILVLSMTACSGGGGTPVTSAPANTSKAETTTKAEESQGDTSGGAATADVTTVDGWAKMMKEKYDGTKIVVSMASHPSTEAFQAMADEFTSLTGIQVEWDVVEQTYLKNKQLLDFQGAHSYDVFMVDSFWNAEYGAKNVVQPLDTYLNDSQMTPEWYDKEDLIPAYCDLGRYKEQTIGIPIAGETRFLAYRTDLFEKYGKEPPKTMDEFLELARFFNGKEDGLYGVALRAQRGIHFASGWLTTMYAFCDGMMDQKTLEPKINDPGVVESLEWYLDMLECAPPDVSTYTHEEALGAFMSGKTAMWLDATAIASAITDPEKSMVYDKVAFAAPPDGPAGESAALADWNISIPNGAKNPEAAWAFMMYMTSRENSLEYVQKGGAATRYSVYENEALVKENPSYPAQLAALEKANGLVERGLQWTPPHEQINQMLDVMGSYASRAQAGEMTAQEACDKAQADVVDLLK